MKLAGGLSEAKTSCPLPISAFSIVPDFVVFVAMEPRSRSHPHPRTEYVLDTFASVFSEDLLYRGPDKSRFYIIPIPPAPPAGTGGTGSLIVDTTDSVVRSVDATLVAF